MLRTAVGVLGVPWDVGFRDLERGLWEQVILSLKRLIGKVGSLPFRPISRLGATFYIRLRPGQALLGRRLFFLVRDTGLVSAVSTETNIAIR